MSQLRTDAIVDADGTGAPDLQTAFHRKAQSS